MDKQRRVQLPQKLREHIGLPLSTDVALCLEDEPIFYLVKLDEICDDDMVLDIVGIDAKGRFVLQNCFIEFYNIDTDSPKKELFFVQKKRLYVSFQSKKNKALD